MFSCILTVLCHLSTSITNYDKETNYVYNLPEEPILSLFSMTLILPLPGNFLVLFFFFFPPRNQKSDIGWVLLWVCAGQTAVEPSTGAVQPTSWSLGHCLSPSRDPRANSLFKVPEHHSDCMDRQESLETSDKYVYICIFLIPIILDYYIVVGCICLITVLNLMQYKVVQISEKFVLICLLPVYDCLC